MTKRYLVDTNVILRFLTGVPEDQARSAARLMKAADDGRMILHVLPIVIAECCYVLQGKLYRLECDRIADILSRFLQSEGIEADEPGLLLEALERYGTRRVDFEDAYMSGLSRKFNGAITFNQKDFLAAGAETYTPEQLTG